MKKILLSILCIMAVIVLVACDNKEQAPESKIDLVADLIDIKYAAGDSKDSVTKDLTLPTAELTHGNAIITWSTDKQNVIRVSGTKGIITLPSEDTLVTLTATIILGDENKDKPFVVTVKSTNIFDNKKPVITGTKDWNLIVGAAAPDWLAGVTATDDTDGTVRVTFDDSKVSLSKLGTYDLTYTATDKAGNTEIVIVKVFVTEELRDIVKPVISGTKNWTLIVGAAKPNWLEGVTASDDIDGTVTVSVDDSDVNLEIVGTYDLIYTATDKAGNVETIVVKVNVTEKPKDTKKPSINGTKDWTHRIGSDKPNWLTGVTATDDVDGNVTVSVDDSKVDLSKEGTYNLIYTATDKSGNTETVTVKVIVREVPANQETYTYTFINPNGQSAGQTYFMDTDQMGSYKFVSGTIASNGQIKSGDGANLALGSSKQQASMELNIKDASSIQLDARRWGNDSKPDSIEVTIDGVSTTYTTIQEFNDALKDVTSISDVKILITGGGSLSRIVLLKLTYTVGKAS